MLPGEKTGEIEAALRSGQYGSAASLARRALAAAPGDATSHLLQGVALASGGQGRQAVAPMRRATWVALDGGALLNLATLLLTLEVRGEAERTLRRGLTLSPQAIQGWELRRHIETDGDLVCLGRLCALTTSLPHEMQYAERRTAAGAAHAAARRLRSLLLGRPELIDLARVMLKSIEVLCRNRPSPGADADDFGRGLACAASGRIEAAAAFFHADFEAVPASVGSRAAYVSAVHLLTNDPPPRLEVPGIGAVGVERHGGALRLVPLDRPVRGLFLFGYNAGGVLLPEADERFGRHSNQWESRAIARALLELGFAVDLVGLFDAWPSPESYDGVFCLHNALSRHAARLRPSCRKIMLLTGSSPDFQNAQEARRLRELKARTGVTAPPVRSLDDVTGELASLRVADECWLFGNDVTRATYEPAIQSKIKLLSPSGAIRRAVPANGPGGNPRRWLWFSGHGAVLKGLDRVVEVFLRRSDWRLEIVGPAAEEPWFQACYGERIGRTPTIAIHGTMSPASFDFTELIGGCGGFLAPSASEGQSTSAITCLQAGLYPVLSRQCGLDLPAGCGVMLETCAQDEIEAAIDAVHRLPDSERRRQVEATTADARRRFSRETFIGTMGEYLREATRVIGR